MTTLIPEPPETEGQVINWAKVLIRQLRDFVSIMETFVSRSSPVNIGHTMPSVGLTIPTGWLSADGSVLDRTAYSVLFGTIGTTFNTGGETGTQFRLPNLTPIKTGVPWIIKAL